MPRKKDYTFTGLGPEANIKENYWQSSDLENIDTALYDFIKDKNVFATTNKGFKPVPTVWVSAERAFQIKHNKELRDKDGVFILPVITVERNSVTKSLTRKGAVFGNAPFDSQGGKITIARRIVQDKTRNFANADSLRLNGQANFPTIAPGKKNSKVVVETASVPLPTYVDITYSISLRAEYQQQLNEMMEPFLIIGEYINYFTINRNGHTYEGFVQEGFGPENNVASMGDEERKYETKIEIKVLGYILGAEKNREGRKINLKENIVDVKIGSERSILDESPDFEFDLPRDVKYRS